ncbi:L-asparaginase 2 [Providencia sp. PROV188]|uniref:L-asparaginase 2 n=1 Tax=Providencia TaxID=586 RepID=UPI0003E27B31|nr:MULTISPECIES: L-asparaginase 2 [Providencia]ETT00628.1 L-asparaginase [Providencia alcalifaciens PAL-3]EUD00265.1 L-asparaginase [Providencia alcalifaciens PAL-1]MTB44509.1 L-asparaginase 2 [Providencia sp. wls1950]MTC23496.1 L-asparaginase 2 [Providencia sp. wls1938]MTC43236.1 L-asparaginase 2 [Providencia sp. wls1921]
MKNRNKALLATLVSLFAASAFAQPNIMVLATGGTIAGGGESATGSSYQAGKVGIDSLLNAVPETKKIANLSGEQLVNIGSQDMNDQVWLTLAKKINQDCNKTDGFVITHGTDTMEETAFFLDLTTACKKPIVMVGAMRPSTALGADGPLNLYNAVVLASDKSAGERGVLMAMNDKVIQGRNVMKMSTTEVQAFDAVNAGAEGYIHDGKVTYYQAPQPRGDKPVFDVSKLDKLPEVGIVYNYANASSAPVKALREEGVKGIVSAGVGNGNMYKTIFDALANAAKEDVVVVRSSRVPTGYTTRNAEVNDNEYGFVASERLNPQKSRVLLQLALTQTKDPKKIQEMFEQY